jgi:hypothetical protein
MHIIRQTLQEKFPPDINAAVSQPITFNELWQVISRGGRKRSPGKDGILLELNIRYWDIIKGELLEAYNFKLQNKNITICQLRGTIVIIPKLGYPASITDYKPNTPLN